MNTRYLARTHAAPLACALCAVLLAMPSVLWCAPVLMISVDGMKPEYILQADAHALKIPFLRSMVRDGVYAQGVTGVWPTVTYPSHTTLITGVSPAVHGIENNLQFDARHTFGDSWYWYAQRIRVPTLWQAAHAQHLSTASVGWPVSVGAASVDSLIPEYWRIFRPTQDLNPDDADLMAAISRPEGMLAEMQTRLGPYMFGNDPSPNGDAIKTKFALDILKRRKPAFMTIHLSALDEEEHGHGPFSAEANAELEILDADLAQLFAAARSNDPEAVAVVVSDHGFVTIPHRVNLYPAFIEAGLLDAHVDPQTHVFRVASWQAQPWGAGGMAAIMLREPSPATLRKVSDLLQSLKADERLGIEAVLDRDALRQRGAFPDAAFLVVMKPGFAIGSDAGAEMVSEVPGVQGSHGFSPEYPEMRAAFFMAGAGIARHRDLGVIDMRQIAPTLARILKVSLPSAERAPLAVQ